MSESIELKDPIYKLIVKFGSGESIQFVTQQPLAPNAVTPESRYGVITSFSCQDPSECTEIAIVNLRQVAMIKTELVPVEQLTAERRMAGIRSGAGPTGDDKGPKSLAQIKFI
jgi:hypothetical protein